MSAGKPRLERVWERVFDALPDLVALIDPDHHILAVNAALAERLGPDPEIVGEPCYRRVHGLDQPPASCPHARLVRSGRAEAEEIFEEKLGGHVLVATTPVRDAEGRLLGSVHVVRDMAATKALREEVERLATTDPLTGLPNRRSFLETLRGELDRSNRYGRPFAVVMLDLDHFKRVNDDYGHTAGDEVLKTLADVLRPAIRRTDVLARIGGEEFAILFPEATLRQAADACERLRLAVTHATVPVAGTRQSARFTVSFGVTEWAAGGDTFEDLVRRADQALYDAKRTGRNRVATLAPKPRPRA